MTLSNKSKESSPAPWCLRDSIDGKSIYIESGAWTVANVLGGHEATLHANAQLIASAPTLKADNDRLQADNAALTERLRRLQDVVRAHIQRGHDIYGCLALSLAALSDDGISQER